MALEDYSKYQRGIIKRYYEHAESLQLQRLAELVGDLFLAEGKKREKLWATATQIMIKLQVPASRIDHVVAAGDPQLLAKLVKELQGSSAKK